MSSRPLIGVTGQQAKARDAKMFLSVLDESPIDIFFAEYAQAVIEAGGLAVYVPYASSLEEFLANMDGLLITGGDDINPQRYGHTAGPHTQESDDQRDDHETQLLALASAQRLPVLGICRGLQVINVACDGTIKQHVPEHALTDGPASAEVHTVNFSPDSTLHGLYGSSLRVNSLHHQSVDELGSDLIATGRSEDGSIEALEHQDLPIVGVQWHPEMMASRPTDPLFTWLVEAATEHRSL